MAIRLGGTVPGERVEGEPGANARTDTSQFLECDDEVRRPASSHGNGDFCTLPEPTTGSTGNTSDIEDKTRVETLYRYDQFPPTLHPSSVDEEEIVLRARR